MHGGVGGGAPRGALLSRSGGLSADAIRPPVDARKVCRVAAPDHNHAHGNAPVSSGTATRYTGWCTVTGGAPLSLRTPGYHPAAATRRSNAHQHCEFLGSVGRMGGARYEHRTARPPRSSRYAQDDSLTLQSKRAQTSPRAGGGAGMRGAWQAAYSVTRRAERVLLLCLSCRAGFHRAKRFGVRRSQTPHSHSAQNPESVTNEQMTAVSTRCAAIRHASRPPLTAFGKPRR
jgi:hypothetical protein